jgi:hypothetical protein
MYEPTLLNCAFCTRGPSSPIRRSVGVWLIAFVLALGATGCGGGKKEITELQRKQADHLAAEANFAMNLRD